MYSIAVTLISSCVFVSCALRLLFSFNKLGFCFEYICLATGPGPEDYGGEDYGGDDYGGGDFDGGDFDGGDFGGDFGD